MANPSVLLAPTNITSTYTLPVLPAGSNRILEIMVYMYNGGGNARVPSVVNSNTITATWVAGDSIATTQTRVAAATYIVLEADIAAVSGQLVNTSGQNGTIKNMVVRMLGDAKQGAPTTSANYYQASPGVTTTISLARAANSLTVSNAFATTGTGITLTNPSKDTSVSFTSGGGLNSGYEADTANTSNSTASSVGGGHYLTMHVMNYELYVARTIDIVNGETVNPPIDVNAANTATTTGLATIASGSISNGTYSSAIIPNMPSGDGDFTFSFPWVDGSVQCPFGNVTLSMTDSGGFSATKSIVAVVPTGYAAIVWSGATDLGEFYLGHYLTLTNDNRVYYPTAVDGITVTINPDGWMSFSSLPVTVPLLLHDCRSGGTGTITTKTLYVTAGGAVVVLSRPDTTLISQSDGLSPRYTSLYPLGNRP